MRRLCAAIVAVGAVAFAPVAPTSADVPVGPGVLASRVRSTSGDAIAGAHVVANGPVDRELDTRADGLALFQALPLGTYDVRVTSPGYRPYETTLVVRRASAQSTVVDLPLAPTDLTNVAAALVTSTTDDRPADDPYLSHALVTLPGVDIVATRDGTGARGVLSGTSAGDTRVELDGIPLPSAAIGLSALRLRSALATDAIEVAPALGAAPTDTPQNAIGGIVGLHTLDPERPLGGGYELGYDSSFGSFQRARAFGGTDRFEVASDVLTGGAQDRAQTFKARLNLSSSTTFDVASYGTQSAQTIGDRDVTNVAPANAYDLRTKLGSASFEARRYVSSSLTSTAGFPIAGTSARVVGTQIRFDLPIGADGVSIGYDGRHEDASLENGALAYGESRATIDLRGHFAVGRGVRAEVGDAFGSGGGASRRGDPHAAVDVRAGRFVARFFAGSAYATAPVDVVALVPASARAFLVLPETAFGYRASVDYRITPATHVSLALFSLRRYDAYATFSQAATRGVELGFERRPAPGRLGASAFVDLTRAYVFGAPSASPRAAFGEAAASDAQLPGDAYSKVRGALDYRGLDGIDVLFGATLVGANNAFDAHALLLGELGLRVPIGTAFEGRLGVENLFRARIADPTLASDFASRELTLTFGRR